MAHTSLPPDEIVQFVDAARIEAVRGTIAWIRVEENEKKVCKQAMCLREREDRCFFLKSNRCSIYETRPGVCREHPFVLTMDESGRKIQSIKLNTASLCRHTLKGKVSRRDLKRAHRQNIDQDERYLLKVRRWNRRTRPGSQAAFLRYLGLYE